MSELTEAILQSKLTEAEQEIKHLEKLVEGYIKAISKPIHQENKRLRDTLEFYANEKLYEHFLEDLVQDKGKRARGILNELRI